MVNLNQVLNNPRTPKNIVYDKVNPSGINASLRTYVGKIFNIASKIVNDRKGMARSGAYQMSDEEFDKELAEKERQKKEEHDRKVAEYEEKQARQRNEAEEAVIKAKKDDAAATEADANAEKGLSNAESGAKAMKDKAGAWWASRKARKEAAPPSPGILSRAGSVGSRGYYAGAATAGAVLATVGTTASSVKARGAQAIGTVAGFLSPYNILFIATLAWHFFIDIPSDFGLMYQRGIFFFVFLSPIAWAWIYGTDTGVDGLKNPFLVSFIALIMPLILLNKTLFGLVPIPSFLKYFLYMAPIWPLFIMFGLPRTRFTKWMTMGYIILILLLSIPTMIFSISNDLNIQTMQVGMMGVGYDLGQKIWGNVKMVVDAVYTLPSKVSSLAQQQIAYAAGDYYTGQVEKGKNAPVGVYIENVAPSDPEFTTDQAVIVWATLKAKALDPDKEIAVTASCYGDAGKGLKVTGDANPTDKSSDVYVIKTKAEEQKDIACEFPPKSFEQGPKQVFIDANFNFDTMSYLKAYFMDLARLRAMKQEKIDPLTQYGITDKNPNAVFTNGPIELNMETIADQPIGISTETPREIKLGITLQNRWEGAIKSIQDLTVKVPPGLDVVYCDHSFKKTACSGDECEDGKYTYVYKFTQEGSGGMKGLSDIKDIKAYQSFVCRLQLDGKDKLLGALPLATGYFKATASYTYQLEKATIVNIKKSEGSGSSMVPGGTGSTGTTGPASFQYSPISSKVSVKKGQQSAFSVRISNPGTLSYGWKVTGVKEDSSPARTSYIFISDAAGDATITFSVLDNKGNIVESKTWDVQVTG